MINHGPTGVSDGGGVLVKIPLPSQVAGNGPLSPGFCPAARPPAAQPIHQALWLWSPLYCGIQPRSVVLEKVTPPEHAWVAAAERDCKAEHRSAIIFPLPIVLN